MTALQMVIMVPAGTIIYKCIYINLTVSGDMTHWMRIKFNFPKVLVHFPDKSRQFELVHVKISMDFRSGMDY